MTKILKARRKVERCIKRTGILIDKTRKSLEKETAAVSYYKALIEEMKQYEQN